MQDQGDVFNCQLYKILAKIIEVFLDEHNIGNKHQTLIINQH